MTKKIHLVESPFQLRLGADGKFRLNFDRHETADGFSYTTVQGKSVAEVFGGLWLHRNNPLFLDMVSALSDADAWHDEARKRQRAHSEKLRRAQAMVRAQKAGGDLEAAMAELRDMAQ